MPFAYGLQEGLEVEDHWEAAVAAQLMAVAAAEVNALVLVVAEAEDPKVVEEEVDYLHSAALEATVADPSAVVAVVEV